MARMAITAPFVASVAFQYILWQMRKDSSQGNEAVNERRTALRR